MNVYLVTRPATNWCQDVGMVIVAKDEGDAKRRAEIQSDDFRNCTDICVELIDLDTPRIVMIENTGA